MDLLLMLAGAGFVFSLLLAGVVITFYPKGPPKQDVNEVVKKCKRCKCDE